MSYRPNTFRLVGGFACPEKLSDVPVASVTECGNRFVHLECGCTLEWYPHSSLRSVDYCLAHAGWIQYADFVALSDHFRFIGVDSPDEFSPMFDIVEYLGAGDADAVKWLRKGDRLAVIPPE